MRATFRPAGQLRRLMRPAGTTAPRPYPYDRYRSRAIGLTAVVALLVGALAVVLNGPAAQATPAAKTQTAAATSGGIKVAYYDQWSIYQNAFYPKALDTEGLAGKLDYLIYDFENIDPANLTCFEATKATDPDPGGESDPNAGDGAGDQFADYQKTFDGSISVDGSSDTWNQPLAGNFHQLQELKKKYPHLKILLSLGGWTYSKYFSDVAATSASRQKFVSSCVDMFIKGDIPASGGYGGPGTAAGIFDGFDIDWEYPASPAGHLGNHYSPNDTANYTALLAEFRSELDAQGAAGGTSQAGGSGGGKRYTLSAALPGGQDKAAKVQTDRIGRYLDFADLMTYDMHGAWDTTGPTNFQDPLYPSASDPSGTIPPGGEKYDIDSVVKGYINGDSAYGIPGGFPAAKINLGIPFYYRGWTGVPAGGDHGLYQSATGPSAGHTLSGNVPGVAMYKELTGVVDNPSDTFWDPTTQSAWFYDGTNFYGGESPQSVQARADYIHCNALGGAMMFSLYDLDPSAKLFNAVVDDVNGSAATCSGGGGTTGGTTSGGTTTGGTTTGGTTTGGTTTGGTTTGGTTTGGTTTGGTTTGGTTTGSTTGGTGGGAIVVNGDFESGALSPWTCTGGTGSVVSSPVHGGAHALAGAASNSDDAQCSQTVTVQPGHTYTLSGYVRGSYVYLGVTGTGTTDTSIWTPGTGGSYAQLKTAFTTGASTTSVTVWVHGWYGQGTYYADDIGVA
ncbi:glycosyl hydrolase family 18 protein [Streptomyces sp. HPF1205]|uniref:glycosyl hydrolase family 18 protein n=1 Tax=Streptomyces sp. HPF1205 TaxID=2873262 RepID=UPI0027DF66B8|nr:glycosyl hydrolase family 18 protein [Streptomyces sp. HPF1205]